MNKTVIAGVVAVVAIVAAGALSVSAFGNGFGMSNATPEQVAQGESLRFQHQADILGISVEKVKDAWAVGKTMPELAKENGITEEQLRTKLQTQRSEQLKERMDTLVSQGVITRAQADQHLSVMKDRTPGEGRGMGGGMHRGGGMMGRGFGF